MIAFDAMGWFESEQFPNALVGDDALDLTGRYLEQLRDAYLDGPGRLPTLAEFEATLAVVLGSVGARWFEELDGKQVTKLQIKSKAAPKRQPYAIGDVFAIRLRAGDYAFGRYIYERPKEGGLIEVFGDLRESPVFDAEVLDYELMGPPLWVSATACLESGAFPILRHDPDFEPEALSELEMLGGPPHAYQIERLDGTVLRPLHPAEWEQWKDRGYVVRTLENVRSTVKR